MSPAIQSAARALSGRIERAGPVFRCARARRPPLRGFRPDALAFVGERPAAQRVVTVGCFNEWTEGQYLLPDTDFGHGMLQALARARDIPDERTYFATTGARL
jgi:hypothetical protein